MNLKFNPPEIYQIELCSICNLECIMCPTRMFPRKNKVQYIDPNLVNVMVERGDFNSSYFIELQMSGEPLLHPKLKEVVSIIKKTGVALGLSTNGYFLSKHIEVLKGLQYLTISVDSFSDYNNIRIPKNGKKRDTQEFINDIKTVLRMASINNIHVDLQFVELTGWEKEFELAKEIFKGYDVNFRSVANSYDLYFENGERSKDLCINPWYSVSIHANGDVAPCCYAHGDDVIYGNLSEQSLADIWLSEKVKKFRESHIIGEYEPICKKCLYPSPALLYHHNMFHDGLKKERLCQK